MLTATLQNNGSFFVWFNLLHSPYCLYLWFALNNNSIISTVAAILGFISESLALSITLILLFRITCPTKLQQLIQTIILGLTLTFFLCDVFSLVVYQTILTWEMVVIIGTSNMNESKSFLVTYLLNYRFCWYSLLLISIGYLLSHGIHRLLAFPSFISFSLTLICLFIPLMKREYFSYFSFRRIFSIGAPVYKEVHTLNKLMNQVSNHTTTIINNNSTIPLFILVLGESTSRSHLSLYGYPLPTTPHLDELQNNGELTVFKDIISPHSHTDSVIRKLFTFCRYGSKFKWYESPTLFDILTLAGYQTIWLSNQEAVSYWGKTPPILAMRCSQRIYTTSRNSFDSERELPDEAILPLLDRVLRQQKKKTFILIHLMGTHGNYRDRYPPKYEVFSPKDELLGEGRQKYLRAQYDNAVLYNDYVISEIIKRIKKSSSIMLYLSDHGEEVYDTTRNYAGHNEIRGSTYMIEIPFLFWMSETFKHDYPQQVARLSSSVDRPYMTDDLIHTLLDLLEISTPEFNPSLSLINTKFDASRKRMYSNQLYVYDNQSKHGVLHKQ